MNTVLCLLLFLGVISGIDGSGLQACKCGWNLLNGSCYYFSKGKTSYSRALNICKNYGGYLVKVNDGTEYNMLHKTAGYFETNTRVNREYYLGLTDIVQEGKWKWSIDKSYVRYRRWMRGQPNNSGGNQDCAVMSSRGNSYRWHDVRCSQSYYYICERPAFGQRKCHCRY